MSRVPAFARAICLPLTCLAAAQPSTKSARIRMLCPVRCAGPGYTALVDELRKLGWIEGKRTIAGWPPSDTRQTRLMPLLSLD